VLAGFRIGLDAASVIASGGRAPTHTRASAPDASDGRLLIKRRPFDKLDSIASSYPRQAHKESSVVPGGVNLPAVERRSGVGMLGQCFCCTGINASACSPCVALMPWRVRFDP
jgi:hypothetical protein